MHFTRSLPSALLASMILAACGGGGSNDTPPPPVIAVAPTPAYVVFADKWRVSM